MPYAIAAAAIYIAIGIGTGLTWPIWFWLLLK